MRRMTNFWAFIKKLAGLIGFTGDKIEVGNDLDVDGDLTINGGDVVQAVSGTSEGDNWKTLTIGDTTKNLGGGGISQEIITNAFTGYENRTSVDSQILIKTGNIYTAKLLVTITSPASGFNNIIISNDVALPDAPIAINAVWYSGSHYQGNSKECFAFITKSGNYKYIYLRVAETGAQFAVNDKVEIWFSTPALIPNS